MAAVLKFRVFGIPVVLRASFLLVAVFLGMTGARSRPSFVVAWVVLVFVSILIHEMGHALTARAFGAQVDVELTAFGGLTHWAIPEDGIRPGRRAVVAAAGSAVGIVFGGIVWAISGFFEPFTVFESFVLRNLVWVNLFWGLLNWLPIRPLDGGHLLRSFLEKVAPTRAEAVARVVFTITAGMVVIAAWRMRSLFIGVLGVWLLFSEFAAPGQTPAMGVPELTYEDPPEGDSAGPDPGGLQGR